MEEVSASTPHGTASARQALLVALRRLGPATPDFLAIELGMSRTTVLQQLRALDTAGLVSRTTERHGVGRPRHRYDLNQAAQALFPSNYADLAHGLLEALEAVGDEALIEAVFAERRRRQGEEIRRRFADRGLDGAPLADRVRELAIIQDEQGYLCECRAGAARGTPDDHAADPIEIAPDGAIRLREHNCAILEVARGTPEACRSELELFREVLGARVTREAHIAAGDRTCTYRIEAPARA